ncbi:outer membrane lipoprotein chaperone LolA [Idiomarina seosinensis]|uniref:outer membrane lipoprotein chaperone LolA n=1 Tax=Idiomarina seosinensis TaxID=281739 RepID=UPI00384AD426
MVKTLLTAALVSSLLPVSAAVDAATADTELSARQELQNRLQQMQSLSADFTQTVTAANGETLQQLTGELAIKRPAQLLWQTDPPDDTLMIASGETVWYYNPFVEQVTLYHQSDIAANSPMLLLLTGTQEQWQDYQVSEPEADYYTVRDNEADSELRLRFDQQQLSSIWLRQQQGDIIEINLAEVQLNPQLSPDKFEFTVPDGVEVDDQR